MSNNKYLQLKIEGKNVELTDAEDLPFVIDYSLEDSNDFQSKESSKSLDITVPAVRANNDILGSFYDPNIENDTIKHALDCLMVENGVEIFKGKALLTNATSQNGKPQDYSLDCYGNNGDWILPLKDKTLHDFVNQNTHLLNDLNIQGSWGYFDGTDETSDYVYAPVRYGKKFSSNDDVINPLDLKPSISIYWLIWRAFKSLGYRIESTFLDSDYFRRKVMPWTWGDFLFMDSTKLDPLKFKATGTVDPSNDPNNYGNSATRFLTGGNVTESWVLGNLPTGSSIYQDTFELKNDVPPLGYDNGGNYSDNGIQKYYVFNNVQASLIGISDIIFSITIPAVLYISTTVSALPDVELYLKWAIFPSGSPTPTSTGNVHLYYGITNDSIQNDEVEFTVPSVPPGATIVFTIIFSYDGHGSDNSCSAKIFSRQEELTTSGYVLNEAFFELKSFKKTTGSLVDFTLYDEFKNYKFLDFLGGVSDTFDLEFQTDPINKVVYIEPCYPYYLNNNPAVKTKGYFDPNKKIDWTQKQDLTQKSTLELYRDSEQLLEFKFKDDSNDGGVKIFNERFSQTAGLSKYFFPDRFKEGTKEIENRFFAPVVHVQMEQWKKYSANQVAPQLITLLPENIANTSADEALYKFLPRIVHYKGPGNSGNNGRINYNGQLQPDGTGIWACPEMFAVNYQVGGENDPILTYGDQNINGTVCHGLMRRFFLQRLAVQRYGKRLTADFHLGMSDITNWLHQEQIIINNAVYYLININGYKPTKDQSTECVLWKFFPITQSDSDSCFPSIQSVQNGQVLSGNDIGFNKLLLLQTDINPQ